MIASWISHDNRKQRRAAKARARRARVELGIQRVTSDAVGEHIVALTLYLVSPTKARLDELAVVEAAKNHVVRYIGSEKSVGDVTAADIEVAREMAQAERVAQVLSRNILSTELPDIQFEMAVVAGMAPGTEDPIEHIVVSWPEEEHPNAEQVEEVLDILLAVTGMSRHQAYAVLHLDTPNPHLHIALNRVDPVTGKRISIGRNIERSIETLHQAIAIIEHRQGWAPQANALYRADDAGCYDRQTDAKVRDAQMEPCGSDADRKRIRQWRAEQKFERKISSAARDFERRTGIESLQRRVIETAAPIFRESDGWDTVHRGLASQGMRYEMLTAGAQIVCGDRDIAASTAWGGASAAKMVERLGAFEPPSPGIVVAKFKDRLLPKLHIAAEKRRARDALRRVQAALNLSVDHARVLIGDRYHDLVATNPLSDSVALNDVRQTASADLASLKNAILLLEKQRRERLRRRRKSLEDRGSAIPDEAENEVVGLVIGGAAAPPTHSTMLLDAEYDIVEVDRRRDYYRASRLAFTECHDRIEIYAVNDDDLRQALRLAHAKWGTISAIGDGRFLDRIARLAVDEGVTVTNPELQVRMARMRNNRELERQLDAIESARAVSSIGETTAEPPGAQSILAILADYAPDFTTWLEQRADPAIPRGRLNASAYAIMVTPELRRQLAELESQQFEFAIELRRAGRRCLAHRQEALKVQHAEWEDAPPLEPFGRLPRLSDLTPSAEDLKRMPIELAPLQSQTAPSVAHARTTIAPSIDRQVDDLDQRYRLWAERARRKQAERIDRDGTTALRARVGDAHLPPQHIKRLLLREAARVQASRSTFARATDQRDRNDIAALGREPTFTQMLALTRVRDPEFLRGLSAADVAEDVLGRVRLVRGRLDFWHVSEPGHDPGALPPLEWIEQDLLNVDFTRLRLTRRDGLVGLSDPDLLEAIHHNHVGLHYPDVQARLELELRLQHERDLAVLAKIAGGLITVSADIDMERMPHARLGLPRGANDDERRHIANMVHDVDAFLSVRAAVRGEGTAQLPLNPSPLASAYLRGIAEGASVAALDLMIVRLRLEQPGFESTELGAAQAGRPRASSAPKRVGIVRAAAGSINPAASDEKSR